MESSQQAFYTPEEVATDFPGNRETSFQIVEKFISQLVEVNLSSLDEETVQFVNHYKKHNENEMAFEGLILEMMKYPKPTNWDDEKVLKCALFLGLDKLSVYDDNFFRKLINYTFAK